MSLREEQCKKVCRILDNVLANRPTERDSLIVATRKAFEALEEPKHIKSKWALHTYIPHNNFCLACRNDSPYNKRWDFCPKCGADMREVTT